MCLDNSVTRDTHVHHWGLLWVSLHSASCCKLAIRDTNPTWCQGHHCTDHLTLEHTLRHTHFTVYRETAFDDWIVQRFTSPPAQYRLYERRFYRSKDPTNSIKVLKEILQRTKCTYAQTIIETKKDIHKVSTSPLVYTNTGWLGDGSHRGQVRQAWTAVGLLPRSPHVKESRL